MNVPMQPRAKLNPLAKLGLDFGPLVLFFFANSYGGIFFATAAFNSRYARYCRRRSMVSFGFCYLLVPYETYHLVLKSTGSHLTSWTSAAFSIPVAVFAYVRLFEWIKRGLS